jgi:acyl transferase domain-containing protein
MTQVAALSQRQLLEQAVRKLRETRLALEAAQRARHEPVAVLGIGLRMPGGTDDPDSYWTLLRDGVDAVAPLVDAADGRRPPAAHRTADGHWAGQLTEVDGFDADFFGIPGPEADRMDPQQRLVLEVAWEAIEDAGLPMERVRGQQTGVFLGVYGTDYLTMQLGGRAEVSAYTAPGGAHSIAANRLSYLLDLHGPSFAVDTACSSSLMAIQLAVRALRHGDCDLALAGGVNLILSPVSTEVTGKVLPLAPGGRCRTFDAAADGIIRGEGCGMLLLARASDAPVPRRRVRGFIRGIAANHDGRTNGLTAPNPRAQADLLRRALADAAAEPDQVVYVEAHGTGTALGDPIEVEALREVYGAGDSPCALGSVKTNFGHQEAAAGVAGLIKALLVLEHGEVPPHLHLRRLNPEIDLTASRLTVPTTRTRLPGEPAGRLAAVSSFGFGGANVHAIVAGPPAVADPSPAPAQTTGKLVLPLSARSPAALAALAQRYAARVDAVPGAAGEVCAAAAAHRTHHRHRMCLVAADPAELVRQLREVAGRSSQTGGSARGEHRIGFVLSGQGSQWIGMGRELLAREPVVRSEVEKWDILVRDLAGWSVIDQLTAAGDGSRLHLTEVAQLSVGALQLGLTALWRSWGVWPEAVVGHSMGEIVAAAVAGMLDRAQAVELLLARARLAEAGARGGAMASIGWPATEVEPLLAGLGRVGIAAVNGPRSTVVSGESSAVDKVAVAAKALGADVRRLPVEYGFHSSLLDDQGAELAATVGHIQAGQGEAAFYSTVTGTRLEAEKLDSGHWARNLRDAVQFEAAVRALAGAGITTYVEIGPHPVLLRDISLTLEQTGTGYLAVGSLRREQPVSGTLDRSLARLYAAGVDVAWEAVLGSSAGRITLPRYPWQRRRHWLAGDPEPAAVPPPAAPVSPAPAEVYLDYIRRRLAEALEQAVDQVAEDAPLAGLALSSLAIVELKNQLESEFGVTVPLQSLLPLLDGGTVRDLAKVVAQ